MRPIPEVGFPCSDRDLTTFGSWLASCMTSCRMREHILACELRLASRSLWTCDSGSLGKLSSKDEFENRMEDLWRALNSCHLFGWAKVVPLVNKSLDFMARVPHMPDTVRIVVCFTGHGKAEHFALMR
jgi:hypothetical protein